jgi:hypothetical protein
MTSANTFADRKEAATIAFNAGQINEMTKTLYSEDIY